MDHFSHTNQPRWLALLLLALACLQAFVLASEYANAASGSKDANAGFEKLQNFERARQAHRAVSSHSERDGSVPEVLEDGQGRGAVVATVVPDVMGYVAGGMDNRDNRYDSGRGLRKRAVEGELSSYGGGYGGSVIGGMVASRDINDWEVEDIVLLATVDGTLYARNRLTGKHLWALHSEKPVVETIDHRELAGLKKSGKGSKADDDLVWIVEPVQDGGLYYFSPAMNGLKNVGISVKELVESAPFSPPGSGRIFNGERKTVTYALDTSNGNVTNVYSTGGSAIVMDVNCKANGLDPLEDDHIHAHGGYRRKGKTILVGRTEYTVTIQSQATQELLWTIKYAEWGPNNSDKDLAKQHGTSLDNRYIISLFDGSIMGFEQHGDGDSVHGSRSKPTFIHRFPTPVVRVFDVVRSLDEETQLADYLILPQPKPTMDLAQAEAQLHKTFVSSTPDMNGWFAMTGVNFPFSAATATRAKWYELKGGWHSLPLHENKSLLIGLHDTIGFAPHVHNHQGSQRPTIDAGDDNTTRQSPSGRNNGVGKKEGEAPSDSYYPGNYEPALLGRSRVLNLAKYNLIDLLVVLPILGIVAYMYLSQRKLMQRVLDNERVVQNRNSVPTINIQDGRIVQHHQPMVVPKMEVDVDDTGRPRLESPVPSPIVPDSVVAARREIEEREKELRKRVVQKTDEPESDGLPVGTPAPPASVVDKPLPSPPVDEQQEEAATPQPQAQQQPVLFTREEDLSSSSPSSTPKLEKIETDLVGDVKNEVKEDGETTPTLDQPEIKPGKVRFGDLEFSSHKQSVLAPAEPKKPEDVTTTPTDLEMIPKKKKTHRGQRGGAKKKKIREAAIERAQQQQQQQQQQQANGVNGVVETAEGVPEAETVAVVNTNTLPDVSQDGVSVDENDLVINNLRISEEIIGYGSHGTVVLKGTFEGKHVAVKRMLNNFYDVAKHEVELLQESDDHPNVIRYYCKQQRSNFLYIALELCPASLYDLFSDNKFLHANLINAMKPETALQQITAGVRHLHSLKIVHRDIKPQNILVQAPKPRRGVFSNTSLHPRFLISDFGLCKKLDNDQSSFRATTAHAAGTSGWRAPELLCDEVTNTPATLPTPTSENSTSLSDTTVIDTLTSRRATKAIDIFSLGCVFYYVLSNGQHPFGDRWLREGNIVQSKYNLDALDSLETTGIEAKDLISRMIARNPKQRPDATTVLMHPFFWAAEKRLQFLLDVSDHFEAEPRDPPSPHLQLLEANSAAILGEDWFIRIDPMVIENLSKYRKYSGQKMLDLLRVLRNKKHHYQDLPPEVQEHLGGLPDGYLNYFLKRFPGLLGHCHAVVKECELHDSMRFRGYFEAPAEHA